jgi:hypothetical protein
MPRRLQEVRGPIRTSGPPPTAHRDFNREEMLEAGVGIEPAYADLQAVCTSFRIKRLSQFSVWPRRICHTGP